MGITYGKRPRLEDVEAGIDPGGFSVSSYALSESGQANFVEKVDMDIVLDHIDDQLDDVNEKLSRRNQY